MVVQMSRTAVMRSSLDLMHCVLFPDFTFYQFPNIFNNIDVRALWGASHCWNLIFSFPCHGLTPYLSKAFEPLSVYVNGTEDKVLGTKLLSINAMSLIK